jgi:hypothetical protein
VIALRHTPWRAESTRPSRMGYDAGLPGFMDIEVKFDGEEIIVTKPGTDFMLAYRKRPDSPTLKLTRSWVDPHTSPAGE